MKEPRQSLTRGTQVLAPIHSNLEGADDTGVCYDR